MEWPFQNLKGLSKFEKPFKKMKGLLKFKGPFKILKASSIRKILKILKILKARDRPFKILRILRIFKISTGPCFSPKYLILRDGIAFSKFRRPIFLKSLYLKAERLWPFQLFEGLQNP